LAKRLAFGTLMSAALVVVVVGEGWLAARGYFFLPPAGRGVGFAILAALLVAAGGVELHRMAEAKGLSPSLSILVVVPGLLCLEPFLWGEQTVWLVLMLFGGMALGALEQGSRWRHQEALGNLGVLMFGVSWLGLGGWFLVHLRLLGRFSEDTLGQVGAVLMFLTCVKSADIGAYLIGRKIGRHKWVPSISPQKTWEGLAGGLVVGIIVASLFAHFLGIMSEGKAVVFGLVVGLTGQLGDLLESMLKRDCGSKDSASLVPEFGGVLDLLDSVLVAGPFGYLLFAWAGYG